jgi:hypothetical protein
VDQATPAPEEWRAVDDFEGSYEVSSLGRVRSLDRWITCANGQRKRLSGRMLRGGRAGRGYSRVFLGKENGRYVHDLVAAAFIGPKRAGMEVLHGPGGMTDNRAANLSYGTREQNAADMLRDGTDPNGDRHGMAKLTWEQVDEIRTRLPAGLRPGTRPKHLRHLPTQQDLADEYGVSQTAIYEIITGRTWRPEFRREAS